MSGTTEPAGGPGSPGSQGSAGSPGSPGSPGANAGQLTEEQARELVERLRSAPVEQVVAEVLSVLLEAAQVKLGRRDARLLIDLTGMVQGHARPYLSDALAGQVEQMLGQLRLAQVEAEGAVGSRPGEEPNDLPTVPPPPGTPVAGSTGQPAQPAPQTSKLWIPGSGRP